MSSEHTHGWLKAFVDFFVLVSGISTASNLTRIQPRPVRPRGFFLFRQKETTQPVMRADELPR
jgi:hypothetical protein